MARSSQLLVLLLGTFVLISLTLEAQGKPSVSFNRRKRQAVEYYDSPIENEEDNFDSESDTNYDRDARRSDTQTFPPFPGYDDYDRWNTEEPEIETTPRSAPPLVLPTSSERIEILNEAVNEPETESDRPFHKQVVPWFKRQWGATKYFFKKHYDNIG
ncbi:unnamed protein product [Orchesella dallaii]|uniref:Uncharacterized protein n=1 Tax=Orchesella dallaii TaxID=48710 RepID=A0ABP1QFS5_9HEXA